MSSVRQNREGCKELSIHPPSQGRTAGLSRAGPKGQAATSRAQCSPQLSCVEPEGSGQTASRRASSQATTEEYVSNGSRGQGRLEAKVRTTAWSQRFKIAHED